MGVTQVPPRKSSNTQQYSPPCQTTRSSRSRSSDDHINIKVVDANHAETFFKIKMSTKLGKLMTAYADRNGQDRNSVKFLYDGQRIGPEDTPSKLEMDDNDSIDVVIEQVGGSC